MRKKATRSVRSTSTSRQGRGRASGPSAPSVQYTVRSIPAHIDKALRRKAQTGGKSLNQVLREALIREVEGEDVPERLYTDLDAVAGAWVEDPAFDEAIRAQDRIDEALWR
jgi:plasmid stability protein